MPVNRIITSSQKTLRFREYTVILLRRRWCHPIICSGWRGTRSSRHSRSLQSFPGLWSSDRYTWRNFLFRGGNSGRKPCHILYELRGNARVCGYQREHWHRLIPMEQLCSSATLHSLQLCNQQTLTLHELRIVYHFLLCCAAVVWVVQC